MNHNKITLEDLEQISKMLGVVEFHNQRDFRNNSNYSGILIQRIKEYLFDSKDYDTNKYFEKAGECLKMEEFAAAQMYLENGFIKSFDHLEKIVQIKPLALEIYQKNNVNPKEAFTAALNITRKVSIIDFQ